MLVKQLRREWHAREQVVPIGDCLCFTPRGLEMGARTVLLPATTDRDLQKIRGQEERMLALLSAAYGRKLHPTVLDSIEKAAQRWTRGEDCLALIHLALAGLNPLEEGREAARRLFMADGLIKAGITPKAILEVLASRADWDLLERYSSSQLRIPAGSGPTSGRWTKVASVLQELTQDAARFLMRAAAAILATGLRSLASNPVALTAGLVLIPKTTDSLVEDEVTGIPGLRYAWNRDETTLRLTYSGPNGLRDINAQLGLDNLFRDGDKIVGRVLDDGTVAIDPAEVSSDLADKDGPNLCPKPVPDKYGRGPLQGEKDKDYEDHIKLLVNPDNPTPRGYGYAFWDASRNKWVFIDDCQHKTGMRVDAKGDYEWALDMKWGRSSLEEDWLDQSRRQLNVSRGFELTWIFSQNSAADYAKELFGRKDDERNRINISVIPRR